MVNICSRGGCSTATSTHMQILMGGLEGRYWLGSHQKRENSEVLTGHFFGLYAGGGKYDLQWKENGYQGEFFYCCRHQLRLGNTDCTQSARNSI